MYPKVVRRSGRERKYEEDCSGRYHVSIRSDLDERRRSGRQEEGRTRQVRHDEVLRHEDEGLQKQRLISRTASCLAGRGQAGLGPFFVDK